MSTIPTDQTPVVINWTKTANFVAVSKMQSVAIVSAGETTIPVANPMVEPVLIKNVSILNYKDYFIETALPINNGVLKVIESIFLNNPDAVFSLLECGSTTPCTMLKTFIDLGNSPIAWYALTFRVFKGGEGFSADERLILNTISVLLANDGEIQKLLVDVSLPSNDPQMTAAYLNIKDTGGILTLDNTKILQPEHSVMGLLAGEIMSPNMNISPVNPYKTMERRLIQSSKPKIVGTTAMEDTNYETLRLMYLSFGTGTVQPIFLNTNFQDGRTFDMVWGNMSISDLINISLNVALMRSANVRDAALLFNQTGITKTGAIVKTALTVAKNAILLNNFYSTFDNVTQKGIGKDQVSTIPFAQFKDQFPEDYENDIYSGTSFYIESLKFIQKFIVNAAL